MSLVKGGSVSTVSVSAEARINGFQPLIPEFVNDLGFGCLSSFVNCSLRAGVFPHSRSLTTLVISLAIFCATRGLIKKRLWGDYDPVNISLPLELQ